MQAPVGLRTPSTAASGRHRLLQFGRFLPGLLFLISLGTFGTYLYRTTVAVTPVVSEVDEMKYITLARKLTWSPDSYTLRGTAVLGRISKEINDKPLFYHPPLFPVLLRLVYELSPEGTCEGLNPRYVIVSILAELLTILTIWIYWSGHGSPLQRMLPAVLLMASSPAAFVATRVWIEWPLTALLFLALTLYHRALRRGDYLSFCLAGLVVGLTMLTKFSAAILLAVLTLYHFYKLGFSSRSCRLFGAGVATALVICLPWYALFYQVYGMFFPSWIGLPTEEMKQRSSFVAFVVHRHPLFYLMILGAAMPTLLASVGIIAKRFRDEDAVLMLITAACFIVAFTLLGLTGRSFQTRYILPAIPPLCVVAGRVAWRFPRRLLLPLALALLFQIYNVHKSVGIGPGHAEMFVHVPFKEKPIFF
jgi:hypothetical protein